MKLRHLLLVGLSTAVLSTYALAVPSQEQRSPIASLEHAVARLLHRGKTNDTSKAAVQQNAQAQTQVPNPNQTDAQTSPVVHPITTSVVPGANQPAPQASAHFANDQDKLSYTIGADLGNNFKKQGFKLNGQMLLKGLQDAQSGNQMLLNKQQMEATLKNFQQQLLAKRASQFKQLAVKNKEMGVSFLADNKAKDGVVTLPSGLQYKIITPGTGVKPKTSDTVTVEYTGRKIDGTVFDSTQKSGKPVNFKVTDVIPGWTEALQLMKTGATWEVFVPANLAYGERGVGGPIGPNETLVFNIHLVGIKGTANKAAPAVTRSVPGTHPSAKSVSRHKS